MLKGSCISLAIKYHIVRFERRCPTEKYRKHANKTQRIAKQKNPAAFATGSDGNCQ
jgi:hypothetical protein